MNEAVARTSAPRLAGLVSLLDRLFPVLWIGLYLLLPVSGWAEEMFETWHDQMKFLEAVNAVALDGRAADVEANILGPAYIGAAALLHGATGLSTEDALVGLNRASYVLSVAAALVLVRALVRRSLTGSPTVSLAAQLMLLAVVFAAGTWYWSDVPWSHFFAAFLAISLYAVRFAPAGPALATAQAGAAGALLALLAATRSFEFAAVVIAWGVVALVSVALRLAPRALGLRAVVAGGLAFLATTAVVYAGTGKRDLFFLYGDNLGRQSAAVLDAEVAETPTFAFALLPVKVVQLFFDPCYLSLCEISNYQTGGGDGTNVDLWSLPLVVQLPALLLLPLCIAGVTVLAVRGLRGDTRTAGDPSWRPLAEMTIAATGLVAGYSASTLSGGSHLRYGFARDYLLPALLVAVVAVVLGSRALWSFLGRRAGRGVSPEILYVVSAVVVAVGVVALSTLGRSSGLPRIESRHLGTVTYTASCADQECRVALEASTTAGRPVAIPESSTLTFGCGTQQARFTVFVSTLAEGVRITETCTDPRLVAAWPTVMGLPPGSFELAAVGVRNA